MSGSDQDTQLQALHEAYLHGRLRLLVGAGVSFGSGLPGWDRLNLDLLAEALIAERDARDHAVALVDPSRRRARAAAVAELATELYQRLGRDAAADFAAAMLGDDLFRKAVARCLYPHSDLHAVPLRAVQRQLAAMAQRTPDISLLYTTNFDLLLELTLAHRDGGPWQDHRRPRAATEDATGRLPAVMHVHGWVEPDGRTGGTLVLTERAYLQLLQQPEAEPNRVIAGLLGHPGPVLIVAMSLSDPNLRRLLHHRRGRLRDDANQIYALMASDDADADELLARYWADEWGVRLLWTRSHDDVPQCLREIQWGIADVPGWFPIAREWVASQVHDPFTDVWQTAAHGGLQALAEYLRTYFAVPTEEVISLSLFLPAEATVEAGWIHKVAGTGAERSGEQAQRHAARRRLEIRRSRPQGIAGIAFLTGSAGEALDGGPAINLGFDAAMIEDWDQHDSARSWRSILAIPVLDTEHWVPVAVVTLTSNFSRPFWVRFGDRTEVEMPLLERVVRRTARRLFTPPEAPRRRPRVVSAPTRD